MRYEFVLLTDWDGTVLTDGTEELVAAVSFADFDLTCGSSELILHGNKIYWEVNVALTTHLLVDWNDDTLTDETEELTGEQRTSLPVMHAMATDNMIHGG